MLTLPSFPRDKLTLVSVISPREREREREMEESAQDWYYQFKSWSDECTYNILTTFSTAVFSMNLEP